MEEVNTPAEKVSERAEEVIDDVAASAWMEMLARFGYATKGIVYIVVGGVAALAAVGLRGETLDVRGVLQEIEDKPFGTAALATVAFGLVGYVLWRWVQALADTDRKGKKLKGVLVRVGYFFSGVVYAGLAATAAKVLIDVDEPDSSSQIQEDWIGRVMAIPAGRTLIILAGCATVAFGLYQIYKGFKAKFRKRLKLAEMGEGQIKLATWSGRIGYAARGLVFCIIGFFATQAALHYNPGEAKGFDEALASLAQNYYGVWTLLAVAVGLIFYGFYMLVESRYRKI